MKTIQAAGLRIADVLVQLEDNAGNALQQFLFDPDGAEKIAHDILKFASMVRAKRQGAAGSA